MIDALEVSSRLAVVRERLEDGLRGGADAIAVVAVTKGFGPEMITAALGAGIGEIGENYAQELRAKEAAISAAGASPHWHYLGVVQRDTARILGPRVWLWQGIADLVGAQRVARAAPGASVLVQVNVTGEAGRNGCTPEQATSLVAALGDLDLAVRGLMAIGPRPPSDRGPDPVATRAAFRALRALVDRLGLEHCSMGMTEDLELAAAEGTTMVRVGRALFGPRPDVGDLRR